MSCEVYRYRFDPSVPIEDVESAMVLAVVASGSLHSDADVRLHARYYLDRERRSCAVDASSNVGRDLNRLFISFLSREVGEDSFRVERVAPSPAPFSEEATA